MAMRFAVLPASSARARTAPAVPAGFSWAQFGDEVVVYGAAGETAAPAARLATLDMRDVHAEPAELHVVVQNGRLFQQHHPEVPVLHDRGRLLLVAIPAGTSPALASDFDPCYAIRPLRADEVVFAKESVERRAPDPRIQQLIGALSRASYEATLRRIASAPTRHSTSSHFRAAVDSARGTFASLGYAVVRQNITVGGAPSRNIVATRKGNGAGSRGTVIVTAHLDSINLKDGPSGLAPGADDNGSGSAGVLEMARVFAQHPATHDLRFILFGGEEQGLFGSRHYVAALPAKERSRIRAVLNMDMIGRSNQARRTVLIEGAALSRRIIDALAQSAASYTSLEVETSLNAAASDHVSFLNAGIPAVLTIEGADSTNEAVHSARDTLDTIDYELALDILRMNVAFVAAELGLV